MNTAILRSRILDMAIRGQLVPQDPNEGTADDLLKTIAAQRGKPITPITDNVPFEIPANWRWVKLGDIAESINYGVSESAKSLGQYKLLRITDIQNNSVNWQTVPHTDFDARKVDNYLLKKGDILFARTGATVGKSFLVNCDVENTIFASYLIRVRLLSVFKKYIIAFFNSTEYWRQISDKSVGIGQPNCNGSSLGNLSLPLPPLAEQHRIVAKVEELLGEVDKIEHAQTDITHAATILRSRVLDMAFSGALTKSNIALWNIDTLNQACLSINAGGDRPSVCKDTPTENCNVPIYSNGVDKQGLYGYTNEAKCIKPCITISARGTIGYPFIRETPFVPIVRLITAVPNPQKLDLRYLYYYILHLRPQSTGTSTPQLTVPDCKAVSIPLPPLSEQRRIVAKLEELFAEIDKLVK